MNRSPNAPREWETILLAAGASRRMGTPKALLPWGRSTLLGHQLRELLATRIARVVLVLGAYSDLLARDEEVVAQAERGTVHVAVNREWSRGKCGSLRVAGQALSSSATDIAILAVDQPTCAEVLEALMGTHEAGEAHCSVPRYNGRGGHPVLLSAQYAPDLGCLEEESQGLRALLERIEHSGRLQHVPVAAPCVRWDMNRPEDFRALRCAPPDTPEYWKDIQGIESK